jgi:hypothetical protein
MSDYSLKTTTQFEVRELSLKFTNGERVDISSIFEEINLYDNMFTPCVSANIVIVDAINLFEKLRLNGDEKVMIRLGKSKDMPDDWRYAKEFSLYTVSNRTNSNMNAQVYTMHLVNSDFIYSLQKKVTQRYQGTYSDAVRKILLDQLRVPNNSPIPDSGQSGLGSIQDSTRLHDFIVPTLSPFDAIKQISKKVTSKDNLPDYVFYETPQTGYNFLPLSTLTQLDARFDINFKPKNTERQIGDELLGARDFKVLSSFNLFDTIRDGSYAGKFVGFDTLTRTQSITTVTDAFSLNDKHANKNSNLVSFENTERKTPFEMFNSRVVTYPYTLSRANLQYIKEKNPSSLNILDNAHEYIFQRKSIFTNLMQKRMSVALPGNFGLFSGEMVNLFVPRFGIKEHNATDKDSLDTTLSGKYIIVGVRHIIQYNKHETIIEVASDSNMDSTK